LPHETAKAGPDHEGQFGPADHSHLATGVTYTCAVDVVLAVWVVADTGALFSVGKVAVLLGVDHAWRRRGFARGDTPGLTWQGTASVTGVRASWW
jgi:hypothetical protein